MRTRSLAALVVGAALAFSSLASPAGFAALTPAHAPLAAYALAASTSESASGLIARVVLPAGVGCPSLDVMMPAKQGSKKVRKAMQERKAGATTLNAFSTLLVCEAPIPKGARAASIAGRSIPAFIPRNIDSIALFGDSGCRLKGTEVQACNDSAQWPLARIAQSIVRDKPDVTIFLGDFFYREESCPTANSAICGGSPAPLPEAPFTDSAWGWVADVLTPMGPLLSATPLVVVRGNHEQCSRGGNGFYLMFDPAFGTSRSCAPAAGVAPTVYSPTRAVDLSIKGGRGLRLVNVDSANGSDNTIDDTIAASLRPLYERAHNLAKASDEAWLLTHRPLSGVLSNQYLPVPQGESTTWTSVTQAYASYGLLDPFSLSLSSHVHIAQAVQIPGQPGELILGNGGTELDPTTAYPIPPYGPLTNASGQPLAPERGTLPTAQSLQTWVTFGYAMAAPAATGWTIALNDVRGEAFATCRLKGRQITCA